jgi:hypothetical protein
MTLSKFLVLRRPRSGRHEGRTTLIQAIVDLLTGSYIGVTDNAYLHINGWQPLPCCRLLYSSCS